MKKIKLLPVVLFFISTVISSGQPESHDKFGPANKINSGVNIHFTKGHEKDLDMMAETGFKFIRMDFICRVRSRKGEFMTGKTMVPTRMSGNIISGLLLLPLTQSLPMLQLRH